MNKKFLIVPLCGLVLFLSGCQSPNAKLREGLQFDEEEQVKDALARGANPYQVPAREEYELPPLSAAAHLGQSEAMRMMLDVGVDPNRPDNFGWHPIHYAAGNPQSHVLAVLEMLLKAKANPNTALPDPSILNKTPPGHESFPNGTTPLIIAALKGNVRGIQLLIKYGAKVDARDADGRTAFFHLGGKMSATDEARLQSPQKISRRTLLHAGADPDPRDKSGRNIKQRELAESRREDAEFQASEQTLERLDDGIAQKKSSPP